MIVTKIKPDPDSQYRLIPCSCGGEPEYVQYGFDALQVDYWSVECPVCKKGTSRYYHIRHDAQIEWNHGEGVK